MANKKSKMNWNLSAEIFIWCHFLLKVEHFFILFVWLCTKLVYEIDGSSVTFFLEILMEFF